MIKDEESLDFILEKNDEKFQNFLKLMVQNEVYNAGPFFQQMADLKQSDVEMHKLDVAKLRIKIRDIKAYKLLMEREEEIRQRNMLGVVKKKFFFPECKHKII